MHSNYKIDYNVALKVDAFLNIYSHISLVFITFYHSSINWLSLFFNCFKYYHRELFILSTQVSILKKTNSHQ